MLRRRSPALRGGDGGDAAAVLAEEVRRYRSRVEVIEDREMAAARALELAGPEDVVVVTGSFFLVGEVREWIQRRARQATRTHL